MNPLLTLVLCFITLGMFMFYWIYKSFVFMNTFKKYDFQKFKIPIYLFIAYYGVFFVFMINSTIGLGLPQIGSLIVGYTPVAVASVFVWLGTIIWCTHKLAKDVKEVEIQHNIEKTISPTLSVFLVFVYMLYFPYVQHHINKLKA